MSVYEPIKVEVLSLLACPAMQANSYTKTSGLTNDSHLVPSVQISHYFIVLSSPSPSPSPPEADKPPGEGKQIFGKTLRRDFVRHFNKNKREPVLVKRGPHSAKGIVPNPLGKRHPFCYIH